MQAPRWWLWLVPDPMWRARIIGMLIGGMLTVAGGTTTWRYTRPEPPWFEFRDLRAEYDPAQNQIRVTGRYNLDRLCEEPERNMVLRRELISNDYRVSTSAVRLDQLALEVGTHKYQDVIRLTEPLTGEGWNVRIMALCSGRLPPVVSPDALVNVRRP